MKLTMASKLIIRMMAAGTFTHIRRNHNETMFEEAAIDVLVFRYCRDPTLPRTISINSEEKVLVHTNGIVTFTTIDPGDDSVQLTELFHISVGMVSGKESVFKNAYHGTVDILNGFDVVGGTVATQPNEPTAPIERIDRYILYTEFPTPDPATNVYLTANRPVLLARKIRRFDETNWFEWGATRNRSTVEAHLGEECLYVSNITRASTVCFKSTIRLFGGGLIMLRPRNPLPNGGMDHIIAYLNSTEFKSNYMYAGRFKIGHKQLACAMIRWSVENY